MQYNNSNYILMTEDKLRMATEQPTKRNSQRIIAVSRPFSSRIAGQNSLSLQRQLAAPVVDDQSRFLFVSLNNDSSGISVVSTRKNSSRGQQTRLPSGLLSPPRRVRDSAGESESSIKKCRIVVSGRKSVSPGCDTKYSGCGKRLVAPSSDDSVAAKLQLYQYKVTRLSKTLAERDKEIARLQHELASTKAECARLRQGNSSLSAQTFCNGTGETTAEEGKSTSQIRPAMSHRSSSQIIGTYWPTPVRRIKHGTVTRRGLAKSVYRSCSQLARGHETSSLWRAPDPVKGETEQTSGTMAVQCVSMRFGDCGRMASARGGSGGEGGLAEQLRDIRLRTVEKLAGAQRIIERLRRIVARCSQSTRSQLDCVSAME